jgi:hypothetical protein
MSCAAQDAGANSAPHAIAPSPVSKQNGWLPRSSAPQASRNGSAPQHGRVHLYRRWGLRFIRQAAPATGAYWRSLCSVDRAAQRSIVTCVLQAAGPVLLASAGSAPGPWAAARHAAAERWSRCAVGRTTGPPGSGGAALLRVCHGCDQGCQPGPSLSACLRTLQCTRCCQLPMLHLLFPSVAAYDSPVLTVSMLPNRDRYLQAQSL